METPANPVPWWTLLAEPKAITGPWGGRPPSLASFAAHALRIDLDEVSLAGRFLDLPDAPPASWRAGDVVRAPALFRFLSVRRLACTGTLPHGADSDVNHGHPTGRTGRCTLEALPDAFLDGDARHPRRPWCRFALRVDDFALELEAGHVDLSVGRRAGQRDG